jgi:DNA-binding CsgD family transcriptional regulator
MRTEIELDTQTYVQDLEKYLQRALFDRDLADPGGAVLLIRGALASGHPARAAGLADATQRLAATKPNDADLAVAALHARALAGQDPAALEDVAGRYPAAMARAAALEDAGLAWAGRGDQDNAAGRLREAYALYEELGAGHRMAWVRSCLRAVGTRVRHWKNSDRPAYGWDSLTDTERRIVDLVAEGLSNREVAGQIFLSAHTVAFHLRHVFWKLGLTSRVQLARLAAEQSAQDAARHPQPA